MEGWKVGLITAACVLVVLFTIWKLILLWATRAYQRMIADNTIDVDTFVGSSPSPKRCLKCVLLNHFQLGNRKPGKVAIPLRIEDSDKVPGLKVTYRSDNPKDNIDTSTTPPPLVVGTIRMGFGHHRIAYAATSWSLASENNETYFHDLLNIESEEATLIKDTDKLYSKGSRLASEIGGPVEKLWGSLTLSGDEDSLRVTCQTAQQLLPLLEGLDKRSPIVASHSLVAAAAVAAGFQNVINLVIDNHAQWFVVVPGALNLVQGPTNYAQFLKMGIPSSDIQLAGHWIPKQLVDGIPETCQWRMERARSSDKPIRMLIPVGGAGAQRKFVCALVKALAPLVASGKVQLFLNAGDHAHMKEAFMQVLVEEDLDYDVVPDMVGVREFCTTMKDSEPTKGVTLFSFEDYFTAVATTDMLCSVSDVLACKPSELAFYPIPKLMIRRVGDHEAFSALRASELGDGTLEARELEDALEYVELFQQGDLLVQMNTSIIDNNKAGIYNGCKNAIRIAMERAEEMNK